MPKPQYPMVKNKGLLGFTVAINFFGITAAWMYFRSTPFIESALTASFAVASGLICRILYEYLCRGNEGLFFFSIGTMSTLPRYATGETPLGTLIRGRLALFAFAVVFTVAVGFCERRRIQRKMNDIDES